MNSEKLYAILDCQEIFDLYEEFEETFLVQLLFYEIEDTKQQAVMMKLV